MIQQIIPKLESNYLADILFEVYDELEKRELDVTDEGELEPIYITMAKDVATKFGPDIVAYDSAKECMDSIDEPPPLPPMPEEIKPVELLKKKAIQHEQMQRFKNQVKDFNKPLLKRAGLFGESKEELEEISQKLHGDYIASELGSQGALKDKFEDFIMYTLLIIVMVSMLTLAFFYIKGKIIWF